ncbi:MAG: hypothetical protein AB1921_11275 [Thermodesulfobacteriota bacterium]
MRKILCFLAALAALWAAGAGPALCAAADLSDVTVTVSAEGADSKASLLAAKRAAVEKAVGALILSQTEVKNFTVNRDIVLSRTEGAVKSYEILSAKSTEGGGVETTIKAVVSLSDVNRELSTMRILFETMEKPRVMVLLSENIGGSRSSICQTELNQKLLEYGFTLVDPAVAAALVKAGDSLVLRAVSGDTAAAAEVGRKNGAEVVIAGNVNLSAGPEVYGMRSGQADVSLSAVSAATGKVLASANVHGAAVHVSLETAQADAIKKAARKIVEKSPQGGKAVFFDQLLSAWQDMAVNGQTIVVRVSNVSEFPVYQALKSLAETLDSDVVSVTQRGWNRPDLTLEIVYTGSSEMLAASLDGKSLGTTGRKVVVKGLTAQEVSAEVK